MHRILPGLPGLIGRAYCRNVLGSSGGAKLISKTFFNQGLDCKWFTRLFLSDQLLDVFGNDINFEVDWVPGLKRGEVGLLRRVGNDGKLDDGSLDGSHREADALNR